MRRLLILLICVSVAANGAEEDNCYHYRFSNSSVYLDPYNTWQVTEALVPAQWEEACAQSEVAWESASCANFSPGSGVGSFSVAIDPDKGGCTYMRMIATWARGEASNTRYMCLERELIECPDDPCVTAMSLAQPGLGAGASVAKSGQMCVSDNGEGGSYSGGLYGKGCEVVKDGAGIGSPDSGHWFGQVKYTGHSCPPTPTPQSLQSDSNCISSGGVTSCASKKKKACGSVNGQAVCLNEIPPGSCTLLGSGGAVCDSASDDLPKDDMDNPLTPDATLDNADGVGPMETGGTINSYNYYSATTLQNAATPLAGTDEGGGSSGSGGDGGEEGGECTEEDCSGELPAEFEALDSFEEITQGFMDRVAAAGVVASVASVGSSMPTGSCPDWDIDVFGQEISLSAPMCTIWGSISGLLSAVMLIAWGLLAARIVLSA